MTEEELIRIAVKVMLITTNAKKDDGRLEEEYIQEPKKVINPERDRINRLEGIMEKYEIKFGIEIQSLQDKIAIIQKDIKTLAQFNAKKDIGTLATHLGNINTRVANLEKKNFEILPEKKESKKGQDQIGKKRGPYKKKAVVKPIKTETKRKAPIFHEAQNDLGTKTITKYLTKINTVLNKSKNFTKEVIIAELRDKIKGTQLAKLGGKATLKEVKKAKWRLDARRRRNAKIGIYGIKDYWKRKKKK